MSNLYNMSNNYDFEIEPDYKVIIYYLTQKNAQQTFFVSYYTPYLFYTLSPQECIGPVQGIGLRDEP